VFRRLLVPLDGSANAERALPWVKRYAAPFATPVVLLRALSKIYPMEGMPFGAHEKSAREYLEGVQKNLAADGVPATIQLQEGSPAESIVFSAVQEQCSLIVMTTRGASKVARWLIGGVTEQVMRLSPIPVLVIRRRSLGAAGSDPKRILVPLDGSMRANRCLPWAERLALFHEIPLEILYVEPEGGHRFKRTRPSRHEISEMLAHWCRLLRRRKVAATYRLSQGDPAQEILNDSSRTDLLVMTTIGRGGLKRWVLGSVAEKVIHGSEAPIFIFKSGVKSRGLSREAASSLVPKDSKTGRSRRRSVNGE
jgi:nucleotide-binding universal stress UspA family protein